MHCFDVSHVGSVISSKKGIINWKPIYPVGWEIYFQEDRKEGPTINNHLHQHRAYYCPHVWQTVLSKSPESVAENKHTAAGSFFNHHSTEHQHNESQLHYQHALLSVHLCHPPTRSPSQPATQWEEGPRVCFVLSALQGIQNIICCSVFDQQWLTVSPVVLCIYAGPRSVWAVGYRTDTTVKRVSFALSSGIGWL